jgi:hypothetical protein
MEARCLVDDARPTTRGWAHIQLGGGAARIPREMEPSTFGLLRQSLLPTPAPCLADAVAVTHRALPPSAADRYGGLAPAVVRSVPVTSARSDSTTSRWSARSKRRRVRVHRGPRAANEKGKPGVSRGRKATGLETRGDPAFQLAGLPGGNRACRSGMAPIGCPRFQLVHLRPHLLHDTPQEPLSRDSSLLRSSGRSCSRCRRCTRP